MILTVYHCWILGSTPDAGTGTHNVDSISITANKQYSTVYKTTYNTTTNISLLNPLLLRHAYTQILSSTNIQQTIILYELTAGILLLLC